MNIEEEINRMHVTILDQRKQFDEGLKQDLPFGELRGLFSEIREKEKYLEVLYVEAEADNTSK